MSKSTLRGRHASSAPARTPLTDLAKAVSSPAVKRGALAAATSGFAVAIAATTANAAPEQTKTNIAPLAKEARNALMVTPEVSVSNEAAWASTAVAASSATPAVEEARPAERAASRTAERRALAERKDAEKKAAKKAAAQAAKPAPAPSASQGSIVGIARNYRGVRYVSGGSTPAGFDCSGFTQYVFAKAGYNIPRSSSAQLRAGQRVSAAEAKPGDLVWWPGHVGIYTGNGNHIAARRPGTPLKEGSLKGLRRGAPVYVRVTK